MSKKVLYDIYDGDKLFLKNVNHGDIEDLFGQTFTNLSTYVMNNWKLHGRYHVRHADSPPDVEEAGRFDLYGPVLVEWDRVCAKLRNRIEWVSEGGRHIKIGGKK